MQYYKIEITDLAERDLEKIGDYIAFDLKSPSTALHLIKNLKKEIHKLNYFPFRHELDEDLVLAGMGIRKLYYKSFRIFYMVDIGSVSVLIVRILHMSVDSKGILYNTLELE